MRNGRLTLIDTAYRDNFMSRGRYAVVYEPLGLHIGTDNRRLALYLLRSRIVF